MSPFSEQGVATARRARTKRCPDLLTGALFTAWVLGMWIGVATAADALSSTAPVSVPVPVPAKGSSSAPMVQPAPEPSHYAPDRFTGRAAMYYGLIWGVDLISVRLVESGQLVRFSYRVLDPAKAQLLNDKRAEAKLEDPKAGVSLVVPTMEKVGQLRQTSEPEGGRSYWMTFSNKGRLVSRGDRVDVVIGRFRASNLVVD